MIMHFVVVRWKDGSLLAPESDPSRSFAEVVQDIWTGQDENVVNVICFDTAIGVGTDVTRKVAEALCAKSHREEDEPYYGLAPLITRFGFQPYQEPRRRAGPLERMLEHAGY